MKCQHYVEHSDGTVEFCGAPAVQNHPYFSLHYRFSMKDAMPLCAECYEWVLANSMESDCIITTPHDHTRGVFTSTDTNGLARLGNRIRTRRRARAAKTH